MNVIPNPWLILGVVLALVASHGAVYFYGGKHKEDSILAEQLRQEELVDKIELAVAEQIKGIKVTNTTIYQKATHEVTKEVVYRESRHTPAGLQLVNSALTNTQPTSGSELSGTDAP